jgi:hypothetical protein
MDKLLVNDSGQLWRSADNRLIKGRVFSQDVLQDGLVFWGAADPNFLTLVDGLVSEAYDIRNTGAKMIQNTVANRPPYSSGNGIDMGGKELTANFTSTVRTMFHVILAKANSPSLLLGNSSNYLEAAFGYTKYTIVNSSTYYHYRNLGKFNSLTGQPSAITIGQKMVAHTLDDFNKTNYTMRLYAATNAYVIEWGWYNRVLTEQEVVYNVNALNAKYSIF